MIKFSFPPVYTPYVYPSLLKMFQSKKKCPPRFDHYFSTVNYILTGSGKEALFIILKTLSKIFPNKKQVIIPALMENIIEGKKESRIVYNRS